MSVFNASVLLLRSLKKHKDDGKKNVTIAVHVRKKSFLCRPLQKSDVKWL